MEELENMGKFTYEEEKKEVYDEEEFKSNEDMITQNSLLL